MLTQIERDWKMRRKLRRNLECDGKWGLKNHLRERFAEWERERERKEEGDLWNKRVLMFKV